MCGFFNMQVQRRGFLDGNRTWRSDVENQIRGGGGSYKVHVDVLSQRKSGGAGAVEAAVQPDVSLRP